MSPIPETELVRPLLLEPLVWGVVVRGLAAGLLVWGMGSWVSRATRGSKA